MNYDKRVLSFTIIIVISLFLSSICIEVFDIEWKPLKNISIIADVLKKKSINKDSLFIATQVVSTTTSLKKQFVDFTLPGRVTAYYVDTNNIVLRNFINKLFELKKGKRRKVRVAFLGDSMIEGDLISSTLRSLMQQQFGGYGVGYLPMNSEFADGRQTANLYTSKNWNEINFRNNNNKSKLYISGRLFTTNNSAFTEAEDKTVMLNKTEEKYLLFGNGANQNINSNNINIFLSGKESFNKILVDSSANNKIKIAVNAGLPVFGISMEAPSGIIVDNFSFRGNSGWEFANMDSSFLSTIAKNNPYDLIIMEYGVNLFDKATDEKFDWYYPNMKKSINKIKTCFSNADVLLMSCADRAFRYGNDYATATGLPVILAMQQKLAYENDVAFYNTFESMGGEGSMVKWVNAKPALAYKDYTHPTQIGSEIIGKSIYDAIMYEYAKQNNKK